MLIDGILTVAARVGPGPRSVGAAAEIASFAEPVREEVAAKGTESFTAKGDSLLWVARPENI